MKTVLSWVIVVLFFGLAISVNTTQIDGSVNVFDFERWEDVTYWVQLVTNTLFLVMLYSSILIAKKNKLIDESEEIAEERRKLFASKDLIIDQNKRGQLDDYLNLIVNTDEKLEDKAYKLELKRRWMRRLRLGVKKIDTEIEAITKYRSALKNDIEKIRLIELNIHKIARSKRPVTFDSLFDIMDYERPNKRIRIGYSDTAETRKLIARSPLSSLLTVFLSILAFGNALIMNSDWKSVLLIMGSVTVAGLIKMFNAIKHAETIAKNKRRSLVKANDEVKSFMSYPVSNLDKLRDIMFAVEEKPFKRDWDDILTIETQPILT